MFPYGIALLAHILVVVYVLGADLGRFYLANLGATAGASTVERITAGHGVIFLGVVTNVALILILPAGAQVAAAIGAYRVIIPPWFTATWIVTATWLLLSFAADRSASRGGHRWLQWADVAARAAMGLGNAYDCLIAWRGMSNAVDSFWLAAKIGIFGLLILTSIPLRRAGWAVRGEMAALAGQPGNAAAAMRLASALAAHRAPILVTWVLVLLAAWLGVTKPG